MQHDSELYLERARDYERKAAEAEDHILALTYHEFARGYRALATYVTKAAGREAASIVELFPAKDQSPESE
jgi:hypothetical protein